MFQRLKKFLGAPVFEGDEEKTRRASQLNTILLAGIFLLIIERSAHIFLGKYPLDVLLSSPIAIVIYLLIGLVFSLRWGHVRTISLILIGGIWVALVAQAASFAGVTDMAFLGMVVVIILAAMLLGPRFGIVVAGMAILAGWGLTYLEVTGNFTPKIDPLFNTMLNLSVILILVALISYLSTTSLSQALAKANFHENELVENQLNLEKRVEARTAELELAGRKIQEGEARLRTIAEISQSFTSLKNFHLLLDEITEQISQKLGYHHVGIYLLDAAGEYAVLRAANSEGGQQLMAQGQRIKVGQVGILGFVLSTGSPRMALDIRKDAALLGTPELAETQSEIALPLRAGGEIIGALDIRSTEAEAFTREDLDTLSLLSGQIAISIQNTRLFEETRQALAEAQVASNLSSRTGWRDITQRGALGYRFSGGLVEPLDEYAGMARKTLKSDEKIDELELLQIPIKIRDEELGALNIRQPGRSTAWSEAEIRLYRSIVERLSAALENARLVEETNSRAERDRTITFIADKLGSSIRVESILRTAAEELSRVISGSEVLIQLQTDPAKATDAGLSS